VSGRGKKEGGKEVKVVGDRRGGGRKGKDRKRKRGRGRGRRGEEKKGR